MSFDQNGEKNSKKMKPLRSESILKNLRHFYCFLLRGRRNKKKLVCFDAYTVCVCVCVCVRERERERERMDIGKYLSRGKGMVLCVLVFTNCRLGCSITKKKYFSKYITQFRHSLTCALVVTYLAPAKIYLCG